MSQKFLLQNVIFTVHEGALKLYVPHDRLPADSPTAANTLDEIAISLFQNTVGIKTGDIFFEQLYTFSSSKTGDVIVTYYFLIPSHMLPHFLEKEWADAEKIQHAIESEDVISYAVQRLRWKVEYTNAVYSLLPDEFTLGELQKTYEAILGRKLDKRNFRRKILSLGLLKKSGKKRSGTPARPAEMYMFSTRKPTLVKIFS